MRAEEIISGICGGGRNREEAVRCLIEEYHRPFSKFFIFKGLNPQDAEDLFQEVVIKVLKGVKKYRPENKAEAWLWQVARNGLTDYQRQSWRESRVITPTSNDGEWNVLLDTTEGAPTVADEDRVDNCVELALKEFEVENPDRAFALLMQMEERSIAEISSAIGRSLGATKEYLSQCRKKLTPFVHHCFELLNN